MNKIQFKKLISDLNDQILNTNDLISCDSNVNRSVNKISEVFMNMLNKHASRQLMSRSEKS